MTDAPLTITLPTDTDLAADLRRYATVSGAEPADLALQMLMAGWKARRWLDREQIDGGSDLDRHVRLVLLLGDCEPEFIAAATGVPPQLVERILAAWSRACSEPAPTPKPDKRRSLRAWTEAERARLAELWAQGMEVKEIAAALGRSPGALGVYVSAHRDLCPNRRNRKPA
ncbi:MAG: hypothetical protein WA975_21535 [Mesorhizobium sp.]